MGYPVQQYPPARVITDAVRALLIEDTDGPGAPFTPQTIAADVSGNVTAVFAQACGYIAGDRVVLSGFTPAAWNGTFTLTAASGTQAQWRNTAVASSSPAPIGVVQGYGTGNRFGDPLLMRYLNSAYRALQRALKTAGSTELKVAQFFLTIPALPSADPSSRLLLGFNGTTLSSDVANPPAYPPADDTNPALPGDLLRPLMLWERPTASTQSFIEMADMTEQGLPELTQASSALEFWEWAEDQITLIGATNDVDIKIRYQRGLMALADGASQILILDGQEFLIYQTAALASSRSDRNGGASFFAQAEQALDRLTRAEVRAQQSVARRPRPFSSRRGFRARYF